MDVLKVGIIGGQKLIRKALNSFLLSLSLPVAVRVAVDAETVVDASQQIIASKPDILIIDTDQPSFCLRWIHIVSSLAPSTKCLLLAGNADERIAVRVARSGAWGLVSKEVGPRELQKAIQTLTEGHMWFSQGVMTRALRQGARAEQPEGSFLEQLTPREAEILTLLAKGFHNKEIAHQLFISENTVKTYVKTIYRKLGVGSRVEAAHLFTDRSEVMTSLASSDH